MLHFQGTVLEIDLWINASLNAQNGKLVLLNLVAWHEFNWVSNARICNKIASKRYQCCQLWKIFLIHVNFGNSFIFTTHLQDKMINETKKDWRLPQIFKAKNSWNSRNIDTSAASHITKKSKSTSHCRAESVSWWNVKFSVITYGYRISVNDGLFSSLIVSVLLGSKFLLMMVSPS